jgi:GNAT superfamily N-acetyltransferase
MSVEVRPFRREDRQQVTALVNAHVQAVMPGVSVSVNAVLSQLEREPGEFIVDPWVTERATLVAEQRGRVVAAAQLLRYGAGEHVGEAFRDSGEIRWLLFWPEAPYWPDSDGAAFALVAGCLQVFERWSVARRYADGALPAPGAYGVPDQWPHIRALYERAGFVHEGHVEIVYLAEVGQLLRPSETPGEALVLQRSLGANGTRLSAVRRDEVAGYIEVEVLEDAGRLTRLSGWADIGNLVVLDAFRNCGVEPWLIGQAADWLSLAHVDRLLAYAWPNEESYIALLDSVGFRELTRTMRGWVRRP